VDVFWNFVQQLRFLMSWIFVSHSVQLLETEPSLLLVLSRGTVCHQTLLHIWRFLRDLCTDSHT